MRSILCHKCNITVGYIETHPDIEAGIAYVANNHVQLSEADYESAAAFYGWN